MLELRSHGRLCDKTGGDGEHRTECDRASYEALQPDIRSVRGRDQGYIHVSISVG